MIRSADYFSTKFLYVLYQYSMLNMFNVVTLFV